jgi:uncharacterized protein (TIRG00374 family)
MARSRKGFLVRLALGLVAFGLLFVLFKPGEILAGLKQADLFYVWVSFALLFLVTVIRTHRWKKVLDDIGLSARFGQLLEMSLISNYFNTLLPGSMGGDVYRVYDLARVSSKKLRPLATVIIERLTGILSLISVCIVAIVLYREMLPYPSWALLLFSGGILAVSLGGLIGIGWVERIYERLKGFLPARFAAKLPEEKIRAVFGVIRDLRGNRIVFLRSYLNGFVLQIVVLLTYWTASLALGRDIPLVLFFVFFPLIEFVSLVPLTVNGIGVKEGLLVYFMKYAGVPPSYSMSLSILYRLLTIVLALVGGAVLVLRKRRQPAA